MRHAELSMDINEMVEILILKILVMKLAEMELDLIQIVLTAMMVI